MRRNSTETKLTEANELRQEMNAETKVNHAATSEHNKAIRRLTIAIIILTAFTVVSTIMSTFNNTGRYAISGSWEKGAIIVDTRTGRAWLRQPRAVYDLGTIDKPKYDKMKRVLGGGLSGTSTIEEMTDN